MAGASICGCADHRPVAQRQRQLVLDSTVKDAPGMLVKANWKTPLPIICAPVGSAGANHSLCVTGMVWPSKVMWAVRRSRIGGKGKTHHAIGDAGDGQP